MNTLNPAVFFSGSPLHRTVQNSIPGRIIFFTACLVFVLGTDIAKVMLAGKIRNRLTPHNIHIIIKDQWHHYYSVLGLLIIWGLLSLKRGLQ